MEQKILMAQERTASTKGANNRLRIAGRIPAVVYGQGKASSISIDSAEFNKKFKVISESTIITLDLGKQKVDVLLKDFQDDIISGKITHIDFYQVDNTKTLHTKVPVHIKNATSAVGVKEGGQLEHNLHEVEVECLPKDLPHEFVVDVSALAMGATIHLSEVAMPKGVKVLTNGDTVVCHIYNPKHMKIDEGAAPEAAAAEAPAAAAPAAAAPKADAKK